MLKWIKGLLDPTPAELLVAISAWEEVHGRPFFKQGQCPFSKHVQKNGVLSRTFRSVRHDN